MVEQQEHRCVACYKSQRSFKPAQICPATVVSAWYSIVTVHTLKCGSLGNFVLLLLSFLRVIDVDMRPGERPVTVASDKNHSQIFTYLLFVPTLLIPSSIFQTSVYIAECRNAGFDCRL